MDFLDTIMSDVHSHSEGGQSVHKIKKGRRFNSGLVVNAQVSILADQYWWRHCPESVVFFWGKGFTTCIFVTVPFSARSFNRELPGQTW